MIVFAHTEFGLLRIKGSGVKRGVDFAPLRPERVFEIPGWIGLSRHTHEIFIDVNFDSMSISFKPLFA